jgi:hypothetical protein
VEGVFSLFFGKGVGWPCRVLVEEGVFLRDTRCSPKWTIQLSPGAPFQVDCKYGGPKLITFLIRQEHCAKPVVSNLTSSNLDSSKCS